MQSHSKFLPRDNYLMAEFKIEMKCTENIAQN